jgi:transmembrane sensor
MDNSRLIELLTRKWASEATAAELAELNLLMDIYPDAVYYEEFFMQLWHRPSPADLSDTEISYQAHKLKFYKDFAPEEAVVFNGEGVVKDKYLLAGLIVCLLFFFCLFYVSSGQLPPADTEIVAAKGIRKKLKLPDGTVVWLKASGKLRFDSQMNKRDVRIVQLQGEGYFDVAQVKNRPFIVFTDKAAIKVLGTALNIKSYPPGKGNEATVMPGLLGPSIPGAPKESKSMSIRAPLALKCDTDTSLSDFQTL